MDTILLCIKVLIYSMAGYFLLKLFFGYNNIFRGLIVPFYGIFGIIASFSHDFRLPGVFLMGILGGFLVNTVFELIHPKLKININYIWFGLFNLLNTYILDGLIDNFLNRRSYISIWLLAIIGLTWASIDLAISLRKSI